MIELVVVVPPAVMLALAVATAVVAAGAGVAAEHAADRGLVAAAAGDDPVAAARAALPRGLAATARITVVHGALTVRVDPPGPLPPLSVRQELPA